VLEDDAIFHEDTLAQLGRSLDELRSLPWEVLHLGGHRWEHVFPNPPGCHHLRTRCSALTCTQAVAYHRRAYQRLLDELPPDVDGMRDWIAVHAGIDQWLGCIEQRYLTDPVVASQPSLLAQEDPQEADRFS